MLRLTNKALSIDPQLFVPSLGKEERRFPQIFSGKDGTAKSKAERSPKAEPKVAGPGTVRKSERAEGFGLPIVP